MLRSSFYYRYVMGTLFDGILVVCVLILVLDQIIIERANGREILFLFLTIILFGGAFLVSTSASGHVFAASMVYIFCARKKPLDTVFKLALAVCVFVTAFIIISSLIGIIPNMLFKKAGRERYCLGFLYALYPSTYIFNITALWSFVRRNELTIPEILLLGGINYWAYDMTRSRMTFVMSLVVLVIFFIMKKWPRLMEDFKLVHPFIGFSYIICTVISVVLTVKYTKAVPWLKKLNSMLSGRLKLGQESLNQYGITLYPREISWVGNGYNTFGETSTGEYNYVDNLFIQLVQRFGLVIFVIILLIMTIMMFISLKKKMYHLAVIFTIVAVHSFFDNLSMYIDFNSFLIAIGVVFETVEIQKIPEKTRPRYHLKGLL